MSAQASSADADLVIEAETPQDAAAAVALVDAAFGPGRFTKSAERLREDNTPIPGLSFVAREAGRVVGSVRLWPAQVGETEVAFLGPIAVEDVQRRRGVGAQLIERACAAARDHGLRAVILVGDEPYFGRFGFSRAKVKLPGPVDPRRVLSRVFEDGLVLEGVARGR